MRRKSIVRLANEKVPFPLAARWAGIEVPYEPGERGLKTWCPYGATEHPDGGAEPAMRVYPENGFCFAENRYFTVVSLLAETWQVSREQAAEAALGRIGWKSQDYRERAALTAVSQEPDEDALAQALADWCEASFPGWRQLQYDPRVSRVRARLLGLLPLVRTAGDCETWLSAAKETMASVLTAVN